MSLATIITNLASVQHPESGKGGCDQNIQFLEEAVQYICQQHTLDGPISLGIKPKLVDAYDNSQQFYETRHKILEAISKADTPGCRLFGSAWLAEAVLFDPANFGVDNVYPYITREVTYKQDPYGVLIQQLSTYLDTQKEYETPPKRKRDKLRHLFPRRPFNKTKEGKGQFRKIKSVLQYIRTTYN
jgi:hypothetical protein